MHLLSSAAASCRACRPRVCVLASAHDSELRVISQTAPSSSPVKRLLSLKRHQAGGCLERQGQASQGREAEQIAPSPATTIYTLRVSTGLARGSALDDYNAGLLVCLVGAEGSAFLQRVQPLADPESIEHELVTACESLDGDVGAGANCRLSLESAAKQRGQGGRSRGSALAARRRFQEGSIDEICFPAPELGPLAGLLISPEAGRWLLDEVDVSSSRTGHTDRFICREALGDGGAKPAAYLTPVPPGAVVYGSGDSAVVLSKDQASELHAFHMQQYSELKTQLLNLTALLVGVGSGTTLALAGPQYALSFALGGSSALLYQFLLQQGIDGIGATGPALSSANPPRLQPGPELSLKLALTNPAVRMALTAGGLLTSFGVLHLMVLNQAGQPDGEAEFRQILVALCGFLCYKLAIGIAAVVPRQQSSLLAGVKDGSTED